MSRYEIPIKVEARSENCKLYRALTGLQSIPETKEYWTLCNRQTSNSESEINQLVALGLITKEQFHGVDNNVELIASNWIDHPTAHWHAGDWLEEIEHWDPALIFLDTMNEPAEALGITASTMLLSPVGSVLLVNMAVTSPYRHITGDDFITELRLRVPDIDNWTVHRQCIEYCGSSTLMRTYALRRDK